MHYYGYTEEQVWWMPFRKALYLLSHVRKIEYRRALPSTLINHTLHIVNSSKEANAPDVREMLPSYARWEEPIPVQSEALSDLSIFLADNEQRWMPQAFIEDMEAEYGWRNLNYWMSRN